MNKHNYFVIFLKKINLLINSLLEKNLKKLNFSNLSSITSGNKVFLTFVALTILFLSYLSIPHIYNKAEIRKELENQLLDKFGLNFVFSKDFSYKFFPRPHFIVTDSSILENKFEVTDIKTLRVFVSLNKLFSLKNLILKDVILENSNFNFNKRNSNLFIKLLDNNYLESTLVIKNSNIFFRNTKEEVLFISKIINMEYYYDPKELKNILTSDHEIFNFPYSLEIYKNQIDKTIFSKININFLKLQIENELNFSNNKKKGLSNLIYDKKKSKANYNWNKNFFNFRYFDKLTNPNFVYTGNINFNPFHSNLSGETKRLDISYFFRSSSLFSELLKTEILNNKNLNIELNINSRKIHKFQNFINLILNFKIREGLIDIDKTKFSWNNYIDFQISDSLLYINQNQLILDGKLALNIKNSVEIYKFLQSSKNLRPELKNLEFNFNYNFDEQIMSFNTIKINNRINKKVNDALKKMTLKDDQLQNKIYFKKMMRKVLAVYVG